MTHELDPLDSGVKDITPMYWRWVGLLILCASGYLSLFVLGWVIGQGIINFFGV